MNRNDGARADARKRLDESIERLEGHGTGDDIVRLLDEHAGYKWWPMTREFICTCKASIGRSYPDPAHRAHVAGALARVIADAKAEHDETCATTDQWRDQRDRADAAEAALADAKAEGIVECLCHEDLINAVGCICHADLRRSMLRDRTDWEATS